MTRDRRILLTRLSVDSGVVLGAFLTAYALRQWELIASLRFPIQPITYYLPVLLVGVPLFGIVIHSAGLYEPVILAGAPPAQLRLIRAVAGWAVVLAFLIFLIDRDPSRFLILLWVILAASAVPLARSLLGRWEIRWWRVSPARTLLVTSSGAHAARTAPAALFPAETTIGHLTLPPETTFDRALPRLVETIRETKPSDVVLAVPSLSPLEACGLLTISAPGGGLRYWVPASLFPLLPQRLPVLLPLHEYAPMDAQASRRGAWRWGGKRAADLLLALSVLPFAGVLGAIITLGILTDSGGPVLFWHTRVGRNGRLFRMPKFRTMQADTPSAADAPRSGADTRVTRVGRWLRRWSLDELPQIWSVLRGEMSWVGPRPEMPHLVAQWSPALRAVRHRVRPGLTGLWQIMGRKELPLREHPEYDLFYVANLSFAVDFMICLQTIPHVLRGRGAF